MVGAALDEFCSRVIRFDPAERDLNELAAEQVEVAFIILHGGEGENGTIQARLAEMGIAYTGPGPAACKLAMDKNACLAQLAAAGLPCGRWRIASVCDRTELSRMGDEFGYPLFVKPNEGGSSIAAAPAADLDQLCAAVEACLAAAGPALIAPRYAGPELTYALLDDEVLPGIEIRAASGFYDFRAKYELDSTVYLCPPTVAPALAKAAGECAQEAFRELGGHGWGRVDLMLEGDELRLLEINTVPGMTSHSLVPKAAQEAGLSYQQLLTRILELSRC